jgi:uncharacterized protein YbjT (DUF2867 family)
VTAVLVTGATGTVGRRVVPRLVAAGLDVVALTRNPAKARVVLGDDVAVVQGDLRRFAHFLDAAPKIDQAVLISSDQDAELEAVAAARGRIRRWVKLSAIGGYDKPAGPHAAVERALHADSPAHVALRANAFMQTLAWYLPMIAPDGDVTLPAGDGRTAWIDAGDIAASLAGAVLADGKWDGLRASITGPQALTVAETLTAVNARAGTAYRHVDAAPTAAAALLENRVGGFGHFLVGHYQAVAQGAFASVSDTVLQITGREPAPLADVVAADPGAWRPATGATT